MVEKFDWTASEMPGKFKAKFGDNCGTLFIDMGACGTFSHRGLLDMRKAFNWLTSQINSL